jgi:hypothetical protein
MSLTEAQLRDDYQVWAEFIDHYNLQQFETASPGNHQQITKDKNFSEFDPPTAEWMAEARSKTRSRAGASTEDLYTIVLDQGDQAQELRDGLKTDYKKDKWLKLYVGKLIAGGVENIQWPIGRVDF